MDIVYKVIRIKSSNIVMIVLDREGVGIDIRTEFAGAVYGVEVSVKDTVLIIPRTFV